MTAHIRPTAALAERALLPEDPGDAMALAQALVDRPLMFNHAHGLWGYTGLAADGQPLTVQSTGLGGASATIVLAELIELGLRRAVRVGTCAALDPELGLGDPLVAVGSIAADGTSRALGADEHSAGDPRLTERLRAAAGPAVRHGLVASTDLFYRPGAPARWDGGGERAPWRARGVLAVELGAAALFTLAARRGIAVACVLTVTDLLVPGASPPRLRDAELAAAVQRAGRLGTTALGVREGSAPAAAGAPVGWPD